MGGHEIGGASVRPDRAKLIRARRDLTPLSVAMFVLELAERVAHALTATGDAGTVYLCHPFLVHAAQLHHGERPRFLAQPPLLPMNADIRSSSDRGELSPVELAIARALATTP